jgi:NADPH:quinone reductase-like Zn-dependent oxidoreductase
MKAVVCMRYGPPEVLHIMEVDKPIPRDNEILVKVRATTVAVADSRIRAFRVPSGAWIPARLALGITKPRKGILGVELAGDVEAVGKDVKRFKEGDAIFASTLSNMGGHAEYVCIAESGPVAVKPADLSYEYAAALPIGGRTAVYFLKKGGIRAGQRVLVYGASGSVGTYAVQMARHFGASVTAVCSAANFDLVKSLGADEVIDYKAGNFEQQLTAYDVIFLAIDELPFAICKRHLKEAGVYINVTLPIPGLAMIWTSFTTQQKIIAGNVPPETAEEMMELKAFAEAGILKPVIDKVYTLDQIVEANRYVDQGHKKGNVVITVQ